MKTILVAFTMSAAAYGSRMLPMTAVHVGVRSEAIMTAAVLLVAASVMRLTFSAERMR